MKKYFFIAFITMNAIVYACDGCGCSIQSADVGILPQFKKHFIGLKYHYRYFYSRSATSTDIANDENYHTLNIWSRFTPHKRVQVFINTPMHYFIQNDQGIQRENWGIGDIWALGNYMIVKSPDSLKTKHLWTVGGGVKLPTGRYNESDSNGILHRNMQMGSGSWDFILATQYILRIKSWGVMSELSGRINTVNPDKYQFGHRISTTIKGFYWKQWRKMSLLSSIGVQYEYAAKDKIYELPMPNTGGNNVNLIGGLDYYVGRFGIGTEVRIPLFSNLSNGYTNAGLQANGQLLFFF